MLCNSTLTQFSALLLLCIGCNRDQHRRKDIPMIIFRGPDGRTLTMEDLRGVTGTFRYEIVGSSDVPAEAQALHQEGRRAGAQGDYRMSLMLLKRASSLAPQWPYAVYDAAYTHLLMKDYDGAREYYRETVKLSPRGFFSAITALDTLEREQKGDLPTGTSHTCSWSGLEIRWKNPKQCATWSNGLSLPPLGRNSHTSQIRKMRGLRPLNMGLLPIRIRRLRGHCRLTTRWR